MHQVVRNLVCILVRHLINRRTNLLRLVMLGRLMVMDRDRHTLLLHHLMLMMHNGHWLLVLQLLRKLLGRNHRLKWQGRLWLQRNLRANNLNMRGCNRWRNDRLWRVYNLAEIALVVLAISEVIGQGAMLTVALVEWVRDWWAGNELW